MVNGKSGVDSSLYEGSRGPVPGSTVATQSIPTCQEPPSAGCYALAHLWPGEPKHPRWRLHKHRRVMEEAAWLRAEDYRRSGGIGRRTLRARMRHIPAPARALQLAVPGGTSTPGTNLHINDHDWMGRGPLMWKDGGVHGLAGPRPRET